MSVPAVSDGHVRSFYGRSYPRASILLDEQDNVKKDRKEPPPSAVAPLLDWATKASWEKGGALIAAELPRPPKPPFTPLYAFLAAKQLKLKASNPSLGDADVLLLAKLDAAKEWEDLSDEVRDVYVRMAEDDAQRYANEVAAFETEHPGLSLHKQRKQKGSTKAPTKPKALLSAWRAFVLQQLEQRVADESALDVGKVLQLQALVMKEAAPIWKNMSEEEKQPFEQQAAEDKKRWEAELECFPEYKAQLDEKATSKAAAQRQKAAKKGILQAARSRNPRPARKRTLPKPVVRAKRATAIGPKRAKRQRKAQKPAVVEEETDESSEESEQEDLDLSNTDSGEDISSDEGDDGAPDEQEEGVETDIVPDTPYSKGDMPEDDEDEDDAAEEDSLREAKNPAELFAAPASQENGLFGWAKTAFISGFKGVQDVLGRGGKNQLGNAAQQAGSPSPAATDLTGEALVGATFSKVFNKEAYAGKVDRYISKYNWYAVSYEDGDDEELTHEELMDLLQSKQTKNARPKSAGLDSQKRKNKKRKK